MKITCKFCSGEMNETMITKFSHWVVYLSKNQYYLGRMVVVLNRHGPEKTTDLSKKEWDELKNILDNLTNALNFLYKCDLVQYIASQMRDRYHFHIYIVPRYKNSIFFYKTEFKEQWGTPAFPTPKKEFDKKILIQIIKDIKPKIK